MSEEKVYKCDWCFTVVEKIKRCRCDRNNICCDECIYKCKGCGYKSCPGCNFSICVDCNERLSECEDCVNNCEECDEPLCEDCEIYYYGNRTCSSCAYYACEFCTNIYHIDDLNNNGLCMNCLAMSRTCHICDWITIDYIYNTKQRIYLCNSCATTTIPGPTEEKKQQ